MFVPSKKLMRKMIEAVVRFGEEPPQKFLLRFGLIFCEKK